MHFLFFRIIFHNQLIHWITILNRDLELLINLQKVDLKVSDLMEVKHTIPDEIDRLCSEYKNFETRVNEIKQEIEDLQKKEEIKKEKKRLREII